MSGWRVAFGPEAPGFGSWDWIGLDLCRALAGVGQQTATFRDSVPDCDVAVFVKFKPPADVLSQLRRTCRLVYCPVDVYGNAADIDADAAALACFDRIVIHCDRLRKYFFPYTAVEYLDHHLKFVADAGPVRPVDGPLLWIGNRGNLPPVIEWANRHALPGELWVLTDFPRDEEVVAAGSLGFRKQHAVRVGRWTPQRHVEWAALCRAAFDVKGDDFRARHKPPTKALDFLASGVPLAMNADSSSAEHLRQKYGFELADLEQRDRWLSAAYYAEIQQLIPRLRGELSLDSVAAQFLTLLQQIRHS